MKLINIGFGNIVSGDRVVAIVSPESAPIKRIVQDARDKGLLIDASCDHIILSAIQTETIAGRAAVKEDIADAKDDGELENEE